MNFDQLWTVKFHPNSLTNDFGREHQIFKYRIINRRQSTTETNYTATTTAATHLHQFLANNCHSTHSLILLTGIFTDTLSTTY